MKHIRNLFIWQLSQLQRYHVGSMYGESSISTDENGDWVNWESIESIINFLNSPLIESMVENNECCIEYFTTGGNFDIEEGAD